MGPRLAEVIAALSLAIDLGLGQPLEHVLHTCLLAVRLGNAVGLSEQELIDVYYLALLRYVGCTAAAHDTATVLGDDVAANAWLLTLDHGRLTEMVGGVLSHVGQGRAGLERARLVIQALAAMPRTGKDVTVAHCEIAQLLAGQLGFAPAMQHALGQVSERWDGRGLPGGLKGEAILLPVRVVQLAQDAAIMHRLGGVAAAIAMARQRAGGAHDPALTERFCRDAQGLLAGAGTASPWDAVLAAEPGLRPHMSQERFEAAAQAMGDFADLKSPYTTGHARGVAGLAAAAAQRCGLPPADVVAVRRAALLHDLGRAGVSTGIWDKPGPLTDGEWERVRLHPYYTERVLARSPALAPLGALAALHHERLDGSGYHRGATAGQLGMGARILAAADVYQALTEPRAHRAAYASDMAADETRRQVRAGQLDGEAVNAVLSAAGHRVRTTRRAWVAGLSNREIEVLRLVARGHSDRQMAALLSVSEHTVHHHIEHIYDKLDVSTRAAATLFALQHDLLDKADGAAK